LAGVITLITDFGTSDWYVASMKGVILSRSPGCTIVDITHEIPPGEVVAAALVLREASSYFPRGTVHVAVVDPGVGTSRAALVARAGGFLFVGPDNGVLSLAMGLHPDPEVRAMERDDIMLEPRSNTFHGRDVFAPAAAYLASGGELSSLGARLEEWVRLELPALRRGTDFVEGHVIYLDRFGNGITDISESELRGLSRKGRLRVMVGGALILDRVHRTYAEALPGTAVAMIGSSGFLEIAVSGGSAKDQLKLKAGATQVVVQCIP